jgi:hypothetical protein
MANAEAIQRALEPFEFDFTYVPGTPYNDKGEVDRGLIRLSYEVTVKYRGKKMLTLPYSMGIAHMKEYEAELKKTNSNYSRITIAGASVIAEILRTGKVRPSAPQTMPKPADVMYCLLCDMDVMHHRDFESWASDCGFDTDSRKAEGIYKACLAQALLMHATITGEHLAQLKEAFADY